MLLETVEPSFAEDIPRNILLIAGLVPYSPVLPLTLWLCHIGAWQKFLVAQRYTGHSPAWFLLQQLSWSTWTQSISQPGRLSAWGWGANKGSRDVILLLDVTPIMKLLEWLWLFAHGGRPHLGCLTGLCTKTFNSWTVQVETYLARVRLAAIMSHGSFITFFTSLQNMAPDRHYIYQTIKMANYNRLHCQGIYGRLKWQRSRKGVPQRCVPDPELPPAQWQWLASAAARGFEWGIGCPHQQAYVLDKATSSFEVLQILKRASGDELYIEVEVKMGTIVDLNSNMKLSLMHFPAEDPGPTKDTQV